MTNSTSNMLNDEPLWKEAQVANYLGLAVKTVQNKRQQGGWIPFIRLSSVAVRYLPQDVFRFVDARRRISTSDCGNASG